MGCLCIFILFFFASDPLTRIPAVTPLSFTHLVELFILSEPWASVFVPFFVEIRIYFIFYFKGTFKSNKG